MRNVSICFYVSQQHVECFQIADKRCKIKQQLCSRASHSASSASQPESATPGSSNSNKQYKTTDKTHERRRISVSLNSASSMESWEPTFHIPRVLLFCSLRFDLIFCAFLLAPLLVLLLSTNPFGLARRALPDWPKWLRLLLLQQLLPSSNHLFSRRQ